MPSVLCLLLLIGYSTQQFFHGDLEPRYSRRTPYLDASDLPEPSYGVGHDRNGRKSSEDKPSEQTAPNFQRPVFLFGDRPDSNGPSRGGDGFMGSGRRRGGPDRRIEPKEDFRSNNEDGSGEESPKVVGLNMQMVAGLYPRKEENERPRFRGGDREEEEDRPRRGEQPSKPQIPPFPPFPKFPEVGNFKPFQPDFPSRRFGGERGAEGNPWDGPAGSSGSQRPPWERDGNGIRPSGQHQPTHEDDSEDRRDDRRGERFGPRGREESEERRPRGPQHGEDPSEESLRENEGRRPQRREDDSAEDGHRQENRKRPELDREDEGSSEVEQRRPRPGANRRHRPEHQERSAEEEPKRNREGKHRRLEPRHEPSHGEEENDEKEDNVDTRNVPEDPQPAQKQETVEKGLEKKEVQEHLRTDQKEFPRPELLVQKKPEAEVREKRTDEVILDMKNVELNVTTAANNTTQPVKVD